ncbi:MAG: tape measure protein, partial [Ghiorsea sp.]
MSDMKLAVKITGDGKDLKASIKGVKSELGSMSGNAEKNSRSSSKSLRTLGNEAKATTSMVGQLSSKLGGLAVGASFVAGFSKLVSVARSFDVINASLVTVTGSTEAAAKAFAGIKDFAATTPFSLEQVANSFVKMKALGLDPSKEALTSYGNTASAMGKDLNQMIEAVADASTGEFERLKEFGIKSSSQGDKVSFVFQGVTTTIGKNAAEIEGYLKNIGSVNFAGAMENRAA